MQILEPCQSSIAYRPPNPWTMSILSLLAEIYGQPNLKMNLRFDIEVHDLPNTFFSLSFFFSKSEFTFLVTTYITSVHQNLKSIKEVNLDQLTPN